MKNNYIFVNKKITIYSLLTLIIYNFPTWSIASAIGDKPILAISGKINKFTDENTKQYFFTEKDLLSIKQTVIKTETVWTKMAYFSGPEITEILKTVDAYGKNIKIIANDNYYQNINIDNIKKYSPILAIKMNNEFLKPDEFGPIFLIYPLSKYKNELSAPMERAKFVWQVKRLEIQ